MKCKQLPLFDLLPSSCGSLSGFARRVLIKERNTAWQLKDHHFLSVRRSSNAWAGRSRNARREENAGKRKRDSPNNLRFLSSNQTNDAHSAFGRDPSVRQPRYFLRSGWPPFPFGLESGRTPVNIRAELIGVGSGVPGGSIPISGAPFTIRAVFMAPKKSRSIDWVALFDGIFRGKTILECEMGHD